VQKKGDLKMGSQSFKAKRGNLWNFDPEQVVVIGKDTEDGLEHELYDKRIDLPLDESMVLNIMAFGVKQSITVRRGSTGNPEVVDGRRRVLHAREANKRLSKAGEPTLTVPAVLERGSADYFEGIAISLNEIRLDDDIMTKAEKAVRILQRNGNDIEKTAMIFGVSGTTIKNWIKLVELAPKVKKAVVNGEISASAASQLHGLEKEQQVAELNKLSETAKQSGKKKATTKSAKKATGKTTAPGKRVLMRLIEDEDLSKAIDPATVYGIKLALGEHLPDENSKLGQLLVKAGYSY
jgi:ParB family chromosome partitioning protein